MAFQVEITYSNGYRCGCCARDWEHSEWVDTLQEALEKVPVELIDGDPLQFNGDMEVTKVTVVDGSTGEEVARATAHWSTGYGRYSGYNFTCWSGFRPDVGSFETVYKGRAKVEETWLEVLEDLREKQAQADLAKAQADLATAQQRLQSLTK